MRGSSRRKRAKLVALLETMNQADAPGSAEPMNALVPFGEFGTLHFARFVIMEDQTLEDFKFWNLPLPVFAVSLVFHRRLRRAGRRASCGIRRA